MSQNTGNNDFFNTVSGVDTAPKKSKGKKIAIISGISALVIAGGGVTAYCCSDLVKNQVNLRIMKPEKYLAWVNEENAKEFAEKAKDEYKTMVEEEKKGGKYSISLKYEASNDAKQIALQKILGDSYMDDEEAQMTREFIEKFTSAKVGTDINFTQAASAGDVYADYNGNRLATFDFAIDNSSLDAFARVPELTEKWLGVSLKDIIEEETGSDEFTKNFEEAFNTISQNPYDIISPDELEDLIIRYTNLWNESVEDIEVEKKESVDICDISVNYTVISTELTGDDLSDIGVKFLKEAKNDKVIKDMFKDVIPEDEYDRYFDEIIDDLQEASGLDVTFVINEYVDAKGDIRGFSAGVPGAGEVSLICGKDGDNVRCESKVTVMGEDIVDVQLIADENDGAYSGDLTCTVNDDGDVFTVKLDFDDYKVVNEEKDYVNGTFTLNIPDVDPIKVKFSSDGNSQDIAYDINLFGKDYGTVTLSYSYDTNVSVSVPSRSDSLFIEDTDTDLELADYVSKENTEKFINDIFTKLGIDDKLASEYSKELTAELYEDYDYDDDYDDDFDIDDEDEDEDEDEDKDIIETTTVKTEEETTAPAEETTEASAETEETTSEEKTEDAA